MEKIIIYTDGSARGNPGPGGFGAVTAYPNHAGEILVSELGEGFDDVTNNQMELLGVISALEFFNNYYDKGTLDEIEFIVFTDSKYVVKGITEWLPGWKKKGWLTTAGEEVKNQDYWQRLEKASEGKRVVYKLLKGHIGILGNERCDVIATSFADSVKDGSSPETLYDGKLSGYSIDSILNPEIPRDLIGTSGAGELGGSKGKKKTQAYSYISMVDGEILTHKTWKECEDRVKGASGARFKKSVSISDEEKIKEEFRKN